MCLLKEVSVIIVNYSSKEKYTCTREYSLLQSLDVNNTLMNVIMRKRKKQNCLLQFLLKTGWNAISDGCCSGADRSFIDI